MPGAIFLSTQLCPDTNSGWHTQLDPREAQREQAPTPTWPDTTTPGNTFTHRYPTILGHSYALGGGQPVGHT